MANQLEGGAWLIIAALGFAAAGVFVLVTDYARLLVARRMWRELTVMGLATVAGALGVVVVFSALGVITLNLVPGG